jgi:mersacidin/lichenicidin family type 2 lantibiotic
VAPQDGRDAATNEVFQEGENVMTRKQIIRAWKDEEYRKSLTDDQRARLPENPAGTMSELTEAELGMVEGGAMPIGKFTNLIPHLPGLC